MQLVVLANEISLPLTIHCFEDFSVFDTHHFLYRHVVLVTILDHLNLLVLRQTILIKDTINLLVVYGFVLVQRVAFLVEQLPEQNVLLRI